VSHARNRTLNRLHRLLAELVPAVHPGTCRRCRRRHCWRVSGRGIWPGGPGGRWPPNSWPSWKCWTASSRRSSGGWPRQSPLPAPG
jgi:hypothetical protein